MTMHVMLLRCRDLDDRTRRGLGEVLGRSFSCDDPDRVLGQYAEAVGNVFVARDDGGRVVGFQFYRRLTVRGRAVHHFSLSGRLPDARYRGLQSRFGTHLVRRAVMRTPPWRPVFLAGVANSPKSYANMHAVGGRIHPDVLRPVAPNPFGDWYGAVAEAVGLEGVGPDGVLRGRMQALGMGLVADPATRGGLADAYADHVGGNLDDGVFTLVSLLPARDLPGYLAATARRRLRRSVRAARTVAA
jgi:hypothetical protein